MSVFCPFCNFHDRFAEVGCMFKCPKELGGCGKMALIVDMNDQERMSRWLTTHEIQGVNGGVTRFV